MDDEALHLFLEADDEVATHAPISEDSIITDLSTPTPDPSPEEDDEEEEPAKPPPSVGSTIDCINHIRLFLTQNGSLKCHDQHWRSLLALESDLELCREATRKLTTLRDFFKE